MVYCYSAKIYPMIYILAVRKVGRLYIKMKMFYFEARVVIGWLVNTLASQPIRKRAQS